MRSSQSVSFLLRLVLLAALSTTGGCASVVTDDASAHESATVAREDAANADIDTYLALGDSVVFGMDPTKDPRLPGVAPEQSWLQENALVGYPNVLQELQRNEGLSGTVVSAACPGESSGSFLDTSAPDAGCQKLYRPNFPLHTTYTGSQMDFANQYLDKIAGAHPSGGKVDKRLVSVQVGANDLFVLQAACKAQVAETDPGSLDPDRAVTACIVKGLPTTLSTLAANLTKIYTNIRARYDGPAVAFLYYAQDYRSEQDLEGIKALNAIVASVAPTFAFQLADGFKRFDKESASFGGSACAAGLLIKLPDATCDIHPSRKGAEQLLAALFDARRPPSTP